MADDQKPQSVKNEKSPDILNVFSELSVARKELQNIRNDLKKSTIKHRKDVENILTLIKGFKCESCLSKREDNLPEAESVANVENNTVSLKAIGVVTTAFTEKRATPRQPSVSNHSRGKLTLFNTIFTNPGHALEGLAEFSHMWILFHFHKNDSIHVRAKVAPPRLNGARTGVFGTRSPHRPSPIGLSLVHIDKVDGTTIYFSGVDMLDGTPVLDIKPYIPQYDNPLYLGNERYSLHQGFSSITNDRDETIDPTTQPREAPDGAECDFDILAAPTTRATFPSIQEIRVPDWITSPVVSRLTVTFSDNARSHLENLKQNDPTFQDEDIEKSIIEVLTEDPRSIYVRERYSNQFYTFLIGRFHVSCKFDDSNKIVQVYRIIVANSMTEREKKNPCDGSDCEK